MKPAPKPFFLRNNRTHLPVAYFSAKESHPVRIEDATAYSTEDAAQAAREKLRFSDRWDVEQHDAPTKPEERLTLKERGFNAPPKEVKP